MNSSEMIQNLKKETFVNRILTWVAVGSLVVGIMIYYNYMDGDIPITGIPPYKITFYNGKSGVGILLNRKISNAVTHSKRHGNRIHHYLRIDNERGELYDDIRIPSASSGETILDYLKSICPQIGAKDYQPYTYDAQRLADIFANPDSATFGDAPDDKQ